MKTSGSYLRAKYQRRHMRLFEAVDKIRLWPSRSGRLHGVKNVQVNGEWIILTTHCGLIFRIRNSNNGRGVRQLKNRWYKEVCKRCGVPNWKIEKYTR